MTNQSIILWFHAFVSYDNFWPHFLQSSSIVMLTNGELWWQIFWLESTKLAKKIETKILAKTNDNNLLPKVRYCVLLLEYKWANKRMKSVQTIFINLLVHVMPCTCHSNLFIFSFPTILSLSQDNNYNNSMWLLSTIKFA